MFTDSDPFCGIDIDDCIDSDDKLHPIAQEIVDHFNSYTEISPSGTGLKIFIKGKKNTSRCKVQIPNSPVSVELYDKKRFFTLTSNINNEMPLQVRECQSELIEFEQKYFPAKGEETNPREEPAINISESEINQWIAEIRKSPDGITFAMLYDQGNTANFDDDHSKADYALLSIIGKYCG